jgi:hypothetical protein
LQTIGIKTLSLSGAGSCKLNTKAPPKSFDRAKEKVERSYKGDATRVLDLVRSTIVVKNTAELQKALQFVLTQATVHLIKNRYDLGYNAEPTGYRDINVQLSFEVLQGSRLADFVFELQMMLKPFASIKENFHHKRYVLARDTAGV